MFELLKISAGMTEDRITRLNEHIKFSLAPNDSYDNMLDTVDTLTFGKKMKQYTNQFLPILQKCWLQRKHKNLKF